MGLRNKLPGYRYKVDINGKAFACARVRYHPTTQRQAADHCESRFGQRLPSLLTCDGFTLEQLTLFEDPDQYLYATSAFGLFIGEYYDVKVYHDGRALGRLVFHAREALFEGPEHTLDVQSLQPVTLTFSTNDEFILPGVA